ncbi:hypothetical protein C0J52_10123 [Blattella germanica]|nr:hypothetical protein C0J52_10123 [Blattella germanica]
MTSNKGMLGKGCWYPPIFWFWFYYRHYSFWKAVRPSTSPTLYLALAYSIAVANKHVPAWFPYISETGDFPPESCIFSLLLNIEAFVIPKPKKKEPWAKHGGGWDWYIASTISEWVLCVTYSFLICTFVPEFYDLELVAPIVRFRPNVLQSKRRLEA